MPDRVPDLRLFRYALASAEHGSFRLAAAALNVQHSAVSRGVKDLESRVGADLFERSHAGVRPTAAGSLFLEEAGQGFDHLQRAMRRVRAMQRGENGRLAVDVCVPFSLISDAFERFRAEHEGVALDIVEATSSESWTGVQQRKLDVAFVSRHLAIGEVSSLYLRDARLFAVLSNAHTLANANSLTLDELGLEEFILGARGIGPDIADHLMRHASKSEPRIRLYRLGQCDLLRMVGKGFGVTVVADSLLDTTPRETVIIPLAGGHSMPVSVVWMESNPNPALKGLLSILREQPTNKTSRDDERESGKAGQSR